MSNDVGQQALNSALEFLVGTALGVVVALLLSDFQKSAVEPLAEMEQRVARGNEFDVEIWVPSTRSGAGISVIA